MAYRGGRRYVQSFENVRLDGSSGLQLRNAGVYLITGGLGGLWLTIAAYLARRYAAKLVLVGRRGPSTAVMDRLREIEAAGGEVVVTAADVTDADAMKEVVKSAIHRFGSLNGIIHAAGVLDDSVIALKQREGTARVLAPKVEGTLVLDSVVRGHDLDFIVLFSSTSAVLGLAGQVDYAAANAFLDAFAYSKRGSTTPILSLGWGPWIGVGMATTEHKLLAGPATVRTESAIDHPFLDACIKKTPEETLYRTRLTIDDDWLVREHQIENFGALVPGTGYLEMARACYDKDDSNGWVEARDVLFTAPFRVGRGECRELKVSLRPINGRCSFRIFSSVPGGGLVDHAQGELGTQSEPAPDNEPLETIRARCQPQPSGSRANPRFRFGPRWDNLKQIEFGEGEALATMELPKEFGDDLRRIALHPALLDVATSSGLQLVEHFDGTGEIYVPVSCDRVRVYRAIPRTSYSHIRLVSKATEREFPSFDVTVIDDQERVLVTAERFTFKRIERNSLAQLAGAQADTDPSEAATKRSQQAGPRREIAAGIAPLKGAEAFELVLNSIRREPVVLVSPGDINAQLHDSVDDSHVRDMEGDTGLVGAGRPGAKAGSEGISTVANAQNDHQGDGERDDVERRVWVMWQAILGVDRLGNQDNFFHFGADSLSALRAVAQIRREFQVNLEVSELYDHPTIEGLASLIRGEID